MNKNFLSINKKVTGLYIGHDTVDLVVLKGTLTGPKLMKFGQIHIYPKNKKEEDIISDSSDNDTSHESSQKASPRKSRDEYVVEAIKRVLKENNVKPDRVVSAIS